MCSDTPRFSYEGPKTAVSADRLVLVGGGVRAVRAGWVLRVGIRVGTGEGYTGVLPSDRKAEAYPSEAGPGSPVGAGVGGDMLQRARPALVPPGGPGRSPAVPSLYQALPPRERRLLANTDEI